MQFYLKQMIASAQGKDVIVVINGGHLLRGAFQLVKSSPYVGKIKIKPKDEVKKWIFFTKEDELMRGGKSSGSKKKTGKKGTVKAQKKKSGDGGLSSVMEVATMIMCAEQNGSANLLRVAMEVADEKKVNLPGREEYTSFVREAGL